VNDIAEGYEIEPADDDLTSSQLQDIEGIECIPEIDAYEEAVVVRVIDGDSIEVNLYGENVEVRYIGINTPEYYSKDQERALEATQANKRLVSGELVYLFKDTSETDKYGRLLRYVLTDEAFVNLELVSQGYAEAKEYWPDTACHLIFKGVK
jgi:endonuclease YncB( thermonuclease family)